MGQKISILLCFLTFFSMTFATPRILGGTETNITQIPYQLELDYYSFEWNFYCGAVVIGPNSALTAAHCVDSLTPEEIRLRAGATERETGQIYNVTDIVIHQNFTKRSNRILENDIAFLIIEDSFQFNDFIQPIELAESEPEDDEVATVSGWGYTSENSWYSRTLMTADLSIINKEHCSDDLGVNITSDVICAGNVLGSKDTCQGDDGGPLIVKEKLAGITSWGFGCGWLHRPRIYVNVAFFKNWIDEQQRILKNEESVEVKRSY